MRILDRYILKQFFLNLVILLVVFGCIFVVIDLLLNADHFIEAADRHAQRDGGQQWTWVLWLIFDFYWPVMCLWYMFFSGLLVTAAMGFTFAAMAKTGELIGTLTGGISMFRVAAPVLVIGCLLNAFSLPIGEFLIPSVIDKVGRTHRDLEKEVKAYNWLYFMPDDQGNLISCRQFNVTNGTLEGLMIVERNAKGETTRQINASDATWDETGNGGWKLNKVELIGVRPPDSETESTPTVITNHLDSYFFPTKLSPEIIQVQMSALHLRLLPLSQLETLAGNPSAEKYHMTIQSIMNSRISFLVVHLLVMLMALPFFMLREQRNMMTQAAKVAGLTLGAWAAAVLIMQVGGQQFNPVAAAWLPVVIYLPLSSTLLLWTKT